MILSALSSRRDFLEKIRLKIKKFAAFNANRACGSGIDMISPAAIALSIMQLPLSSLAQSKRQH